MREAFDLPGVALAVAVNFLVILSFTNLDQTFTFFCGDLFGIDERGTGYVLAFIGVVAAGVQGGLVRPLAKRFDEARLMRAGAAIQAVAFAGLVVAGTLGSHALLLRVGRPARRSATASRSRRRRRSSRSAPPPTGRAARSGTNQSLREPRAHLRPRRRRVALLEPRRRGLRTPPRRPGMVVALALAMGLRKSGDGRLT